MDDSDKFGTDDLLTKHSLAADFYANASPTISRYYALEAHKIYENLQLKEKFTARTCPHCCSVWRPNNVKITFKPRLKITPKIKRLLERSDNNQVLGKYQSKVVKEFKEGNNKLIYTCLTCKKNTTQKIASRPKKPEKVNKSAPDPKKQPEKTSVQPQKNRGNVKQCKVEKPKKRTLLECLMADRFKFQMATSGKR